MDVFVVYDNIQFSKKGWFHRNNVLINGNKMLFSLPLKKDSDYLDVLDRYLAESSEKKINKILEKIKHAYKKAPFFSDAFPIIEDIFLYNEKNLFKYIYYSIIKICRYLAIDTKIVISSGIDIDHSLKSSEKVIAINKELNAKTYINAIGGQTLYDHSKFCNENIALLFLESEVPKYKQFNNEFISYLSIVDIMMFNSRDEIKEMLKKFKLKSKIS